MISFRSAVAEDVLVIRDLLQALSDHDGGPEVGPASALLKHGFGERPLFRAVLAEDEGEAVGLVLFYPDFSTLRGEPGLYVQDLFVEERLRGQGVGRQLLSRARALAESCWGARYMTLSVSPDNTAAKAAYEKLGFRPRGYDFLNLDGEAFASLERS